MVLGCTLGESEDTLSEARCILYMLFTYLRRLMIVIVGINYSETLWAWQVDFKSK